MKMQNKKYENGLVIGKFYPPHLGHKFLIDYANNLSENLYILVCDDKRQKISAEQRRAWLQTIHSNVNVKVIPEIYDDDNSQAWAEHTKKFLGFAPDVVFTSEDYGHAYCKYLDCVHVQVDKERKNVNISATKIRNDLQNNLQFLHPVVRDFFVPRVVVLGAESTGTTTLSKALARVYNTNWVPEFGRYYSESLQNIWEYVWKQSDFEFIANMQNQLESYLAISANKVLICDTDAFTTSLWEERYLGQTSDEVRLLGKSDYKKLYFLTGDEIPFVQDGIRDGEQIRHNMHQRFIEVLNSQNLHWVLVEGSVDERLEKAKIEINKFLKESFFH